MFMSLPRRAHRWVRLARLTAAATIVIAHFALPMSVSAAEPDEVRVGVYVNNIQEVDLQDHSFALDYYIWFRWTNPDIDPSATAEVMNPYESWATIVTPIYEEPQALADGSLHQILRIQGFFSNQLPLQKYPFDEQTLTVQYEDNANTRDTLVYVPDTEPITINDKVFLPGYDIGTPSMTITETPYPNSFGNTDLAEPETYSRLDFTVPVSRPWFTYIVKIIAPIFLVVLVAALVFLIPAAYVEGRIGMGITALLTLVALQFTTNQDLPTVSYLMMLDVLYIISFGFVLAVMAQATRTAWMVKNDQAERADAADRRMIVISLVAYVVAVAITVLAYLL